jgi:hypothetical protein
MKRLIRALRRYDLKMELITAALLVAGVLWAARPASAFWCAPWPLCTTGGAIVDVMNVPERIAILTGKQDAVANIAQVFKQMAARTHQLNALFRATTGSRGLGGIARGGYEQDLGQWAPGGLDATLGDVAARRASGALSAGLAAYTQRFPDLPDSAFIGSGRQQEIDAYRRQRAAVALLAAASRKVLEDMPNVAARASALASQIDQVGDLKAALDLRNRLRAEALIQATRQNQMAALDQARRAAADARQQAVWAQSQTELAQAYQSVARRVGGTFSH